jgi:hypothetical protein
VSYWGYREKKRVKESLVIRPRAEIAGNHKEYHTISPIRAYYEGRWLLGYKRRDGSGVDYWEPDGDDHDNRTLKDAYILNLRS